MLLFMEETFKKRFGQNVYRLRHKLQATQEKLSEGADLSRRYLLSLEAGQKSPSLESICKLRKALGCSWEELMTGL